MDVSEIHPRHVDAVEPGIEAPGIAWGKFQMELLRGQEGARLLRIAAAKDAMPVKNRRQAECHCFLRCLKNSSELGFAE